MSKVDVEIEVEVTVKPARPYDAPHWAKVRYSLTGGATPIEALQDATDLIDRAKALLTTRLQDFAEGWPHKETTS